MSTPFLVNFASALVARLVETRQLEVVEGSEAAVAEFVAAQLFAARQGSQLIATTSKALVASPHVEELWADDDELKQLVQELKTGGR